jgi:hypothetical protein
MNLDLLKFFTISAGVSNLYLINLLAYVAYSILIFYWAMNSGLHVHKADALPLEPQLQSILLWLFWRWGIL